MRTQRCLSWWTRYQNVAYYVLRKGWLKRVLGSVLLSDLFRLFYTLTWFFFFFWHHTVRSLCDKIKWQKQRLAILLKQTGLLYSCCRKAATHIWMWWAFEDRARTPLCEWTHSVCSKQSAVLPSVSRWHELYSLLLVRNRISSIFIAHLWQDEKKKKAFSSEMDFFPPQILNANLKYATDFVTYFQVHALLLLIQSNWCWLWTKWIHV